jgi:hypothetical protein
MSRIQGRKLDGDVYILYRFLAHKRTMDGCGEQANVRLLIIDGADTRCKHDTDAKNNICR